VAGIPVRHLGDYIREQRSSSQISLRQLAKVAGVSNPYLSQIERGLRKPSAEILQQIAKGLRVSAEALYVQAGILEQRKGSAVADAVLADAELNDRQKQVLLEIYDSFRKEETAALAALNVTAVAGATGVGSAEPLAPPSTPVPSTPNEAQADRPAAATTRAPSKTPTKSTAGTSTVRGTKKTSTKKTSTRKTSTRKTTPKPSGGSA